MPGLSSHPQFALAQAQQTGPGGIVSFDVRGGRAAAWQVVDATRMCSITANLGDTRTTITHPASTTHGRISADARAAAGIGEGLLRLSVGLEDPVDLIADLDQALSGRSTGRMTSSFINATMDEFAMIALVYSAGLPCMPAKLIF